MSYVGASPAYTTGGAVLSWNRGALAVGACGSVQWWGTVNSMPFNPFQINREVYASADTKEFYKVYYMVP
jgi:hypothetical protein